MQDVLKRSVIVLVCAVSVLAATAACHTTQGVGQDMQSAGRGIERAAK